MRRKKAASAPARRRSAVDKTTVRKPAVAHSARARKLNVTWRDVLRAAGASPIGQNAIKRAAIARMLKAHPEWSDRRIAAAVHIIIITDDDLDVGLEQRR